MQRLFLSSRHVMARRGHLMCGRTLMKNIVTPFQMVQSHHRHTLFHAKDFSVERLDESDLEHMPDSWKQRTSSVATTAANENDHVVVNAGIHVAVLSRMENGVFAFLRRYRPAVDDTILELPSMSLAQYEERMREAYRQTADNKKGQEFEFDYGPKDVAMFILQDQIGVVAEEADVKPMFELYVSPGISNERLLVYFNEKNIDMTEDAQAHAARLEKEYDAKLEYLHQDKIMSNFLESNFIDGKTATAVSQFLLSISDQTTRNKVQSRQQVVLFAGFAVGLFMGLLLTQLVPGLSQSPPPPPSF